MEMKKDEAVSRNSPFFIFFSIWSVDLWNRNCFYGDDWWRWKLHTITFAFAFALFKSAKCHTWTLRMKMCVYFIDYTRAVSVLCRVLTRERPVIEEKQIFSFLISYNKLVRYTVSQEVWIVNLSDVCVCMCVWSNNNRVNGQRFELVMHCCRCHRYHTNTIFE